VHKDASRVMVEFSFRATPEPEMESLLIHKSVGEYSDSYKELTKDFYMKW